MRTLIALIPILWTLGCTTTGGTGRDFLSVPCDLGQVCEFVGEVRFYPPSHHAIRPVVLYAGSTCYLLALDENDIVRFSSLDHKIVRVLGALHQQPHIEGAMWYRIFGRGIVPGLCEQGDIVVVESISE
jgi:hypothetical protein